MKKYSDYILKENEDGVKEYLAQFEEMYKHHADPHAQSNVDVLEADILITLAKKTIRLQKYNKIIDVGCGLGILTNRIRNELKINDVTGLDISKTAVNKAKRNFKNIKFFEYDLGKTENKNSNASIKGDGSRNLVIASNSLYFVKEKDIHTAIKNIKSLTGNNGTFLFSIHLPKFQNFGRFITDLHTAEKLMLAHSFRTIIKNDLFINFNENKEQNIQEQRRYIFLVCEST